MTAWIRKFRFRALGLVWTPLIVGVALSGARLSAQDEPAQTDASSRPANPALYGPLPTQTYHPLRLGLLDPVPESAIPAGVGFRGVDLSLGYASLFFRRFSRSDFSSVLIDSEVTRLSLALRFGLTDALDARLDFSAWSFNAGFMDRELTDFHKLFGLPNAGRERRPVNAFLHQVRARDGRVVWKGDGGDVVGGNLGLQSRFHLHREKLDERGGALDLALRFSAKLPSGSDHAGLDSGHADAGGGVLATFRAGAWAIDGNVDLVIPGGYDFRVVTEDFDVKPFVKATLSGQYALAHTWGLIAQASVASPALSAPARLLSLTRVASIGHIGVRYAAGSFAWYAAFGEDMSVEGEADFELSSGITYTW